MNIADLVVVEVEYIHDDAVHLKVGDDRFILQAGDNLTLSDLRINVS